MKTQRAERLWQALEDHSMTCFDSGPRLLFLWCVHSLGLYGVSYQRLLYDKETHGERNTAVFLCLSERNTLSKFGGRAVQHTRRRFGGVVAIR